MDYTTQELMEMIKTLNQRLEKVEALLSYHYNIDLCLDNLTTADNVTIVDAGRILRL